MAGPEPTADQVDAIESMEREGLLALWASTLGGEPPARLSQPFLRRILAWELQAREQGGLPAAVRRKLDSLAAAQAGGKARTPTSPKLRPGGRFLREWNGVTHVVDVVEGGFLWKGERHRSLSAIARAITGAHWSGPRFFGLQEGGGTAKAKAAGTRTGRRGSAGTEGQPPASARGELTPGALPFATKPQTGPKAGLVMAQPDAGEEAA